jgi:serine/threonine-protein kinase
LKELGLARKGMPNNAEVAMWTGTVLKRAGRYKEALVSYKRSLELDPLNPRPAREIGVVHNYLREYADAERSFDLCFALARQETSCYYAKVSLYWDWGKLKESRDTLEARPKTDDTALIWFWQELLEGSYQAALDRLDSWQPSGRWALIGKELNAALTHDLLGQPQLARGAWDAARILLEEQAPEGLGEADRARALGLAYAGLGRKDEAIAEGKRALQLVPLQRYPVQNPGLRFNLALIYTMVEEYDAALDELEYLLSTPSNFSIHLLQLNPRWKPLWKHPRFQELVERYETPSE